MSSKFAQISRNACLTLTVGNVKTAVKSYTLSKRYIYTIAKAAVLNIMFHRIPTDESEFLTKKFQNVEYKSPRLESKNPLIRNYHSHMQGFKDALEKGYLKEMYMYFIDVDTNDILENYKFALSYAADKENAPNSPAVKPNSLLESTVDFLRALEDLGSYSKFDENVIMKIELTYFDDTPKEYQPPGYKDVAEMGAYRFKIPKVGNSLIIGNVFTGFHKMKCRGRGNIFDNLRSSQVTPDMNSLAMADCYEVQPMSIQNTSNPPIETSDLMLNAEVKIIPNTPKPLIPTGDLMIKSEKKKKFDSNANSLIGCVSDPRRYLVNSPPLSAISIMSDEDNQNKENLSCICNNCNISFEVIRCTGCKKTSHLSCQGYLNKSYVKQPFKCFKCNDGDDIMSKTITPENFPVICKIRFILATLFKESKVPKNIAETFKKTLTQLQDINFIKFKEDGTLETIDSVLKNVFDFRYKPLTTN